MAKKCYFITYTNCVNVVGSAYFCSESLEYISTGGSCGGGYFLSADLGFGSHNASEKAGTATIVPCSNCPNCCSDLTANQPYDCVNGGCVPKTTYNTPGVYASLAACQSGCAKNSNCTGECVSAAELAALSSAASNLQAKNCN